MSETNERSLRIEKVPASTLVRIAWNGGGEVPQSLQGSFTSHAAARQAIEVWKINEAKREVREESPPLDEAKAARKPGRPPAQHI
jgi:hypothetical protein